VEHIGHTKDIRNAYNILVGIAEGKRPFGRLRSRLEDITKHVKEIGGVDWIPLAQDREQWRNFVKTTKSGNFLTT